MNYTTKIRIYEVEKRRIYQNIKLTTSEKEEKVKKVKDIAIKLGRSLASVNHKIEGLALSKYESAKKVKRCKLYSGIGCIRKAKCCRKCSLYGNCNLTVRCDNSPELCSMYK